MPVRMTDLCDCGRPLQLHYSDPRNLRAIEALIADLGLTVVLHVSKGSWRVPRHYIALHGIRPSELPELAKKYGWARER